MSIPPSNFPSVKPQDLVSPLKSFSNWLLKNRSLHHYVVREYKQYKSYRKEYIERFTIDGWQWSNVVASEEYDPNAVKQEDSLLRVIDRWLYESQGDKLRFLLTGDVGAGKTTSFRRIAAEYLYWAQWLMRITSRWPRVCWKVVNALVAVACRLPKGKQRIDRWLGYDKRTLPFFTIPLYIDLKNLGQEQLTEEVYKRITAWVRDAQVVETSLSEGCFLILFDVPNEDEALPRGEATANRFQAIREFVDTYPQCAYCVTCSEKDFRPEYLRSEGFRSQSLREFGNEGVQKYLELRKVSDLFTYLRENEGLLDLARHPDVANFIIKVYQKQSAQPARCKPAKGTILSGIISEMASLKDIDRHIWLEGTDVGILELLAGAMINRPKPEVSLEEMLWKDIADSSTVRRLLHSMLVRLDESKNLSFSCPIWRNFFWARHLHNNPSIWQKVLEGKTCFVGGATWADILVIRAGMMNEPQEVRCYINSILDSGISSVAYLGISCFLGSGAFRNRFYPIWWGTRSGHPLHDACLGFKEYQLELRDKLEKEIVHGPAALRQRPEWIEKFWGDEGVELFLRPILEKGERMEGSLRIAGVIRSEQAVECLFRFGLASNHPDFQRIAIEILGGLWDYPVVSHLAKKIPPETLETCEGIIEVLRLRPKMESKEYEKYQRDPTHPYSLYIASEISRSEDPSRHELVRRLLEQFTFDSSHSEKARECLLHLMLMKSDQNVKSWLIDYAKIDSQYQPSAIRIWRDYSSQTRDYHSFKSWMGMFDQVAQLRSESAIIQIAGFVTDVVEKRDRDAEPLVDRLISLVKDTVVLHF